MFFWALFYVDFQRKWPQFGAQNHEMFLGPKYGLYRAKSVLPALLEGLVQGYPVPPFIFGTFTRGKESLPLGWGPKWGSCVVAAALALSTVAGPLVLAGITTSSLCIIHLSTVLALAWSHCPLFLLSI